MKRSICFVLLMVLLIINIVGCSNQIDNDINPDNPIPKQEFDIKEFDLGNSMISLDNGNKVPFKMQGVISVPKTSKNCPVVFIMHGDNKENGVTVDRLDKGFNYLAGELASRGILAVSMDVSPAYEDNSDSVSTFERLGEIFEANLNKLKESVTSTNTNFGLDLKGRADVTKIALIGQDKSGQGAIYLSNKYKDIIKGQLLINPTSVIEYKGEYPDVNTGIVIPQFGGDINELYGQDVYESIRQKEKKTAWASNAYLYGANNNYFNSSLKDDDGVSKNDRISREDQEKFLKNYAVDFINATFMMQKKPALLMVSEYNKTEYYGLKVMTALTAPDSLIIAYKDKGQMHPKNASSGKVVDSVLQDKKTDGVFITPGKPQTLELFNVSWDNTDIAENQDAAAANYIPESDKDLSKYKYISIYMAIDPTSELFNSNKEFPVSIRITDTNKKQETVEINKKSPVLKYQKGELITVGNKKVWSNAIPLGNVYVPIFEFKNVDLKNVSTIEVVFGKGNQGAVMVGEMVAVPTLNKK